MPRTRVIALLCSLLLSAFAVIGFATPAAAHAELESTTPADGSRFVGVPPSVTLVFGEDIFAPSVKLSVRNASGTDIPLPQAEVTGGTVTAQWPQDAPGDTYKVSFRVVSKDGHPVTGSFSFTYADEEVPPPDETPSASASPSVEATATATPSGDAIVSAPVVPGTPTPVETTTAGTSATASSTPGASAQASSAVPEPTTSPVSAAEPTDHTGHYILAGISVAVVLAIVVAAVVRGRSSRDAQGS